MEALYERISDVVNAHYSAGSRDPKYLYLGSYEFSVLEKHCNEHGPTASLFLGAMTGNRPKFEGMEVVEVKELSHVSVGGLMA